MYSVTDIGHVNLVTDYEWVFFVFHVFFFVLCCFLYLLFLLPYIELNTCMQYCVRNKIILYSSKHAGAFVYEDDILHWLACI